MGNSSAIYKIIHLATYGFETSLAFVRDRNVFPPNSDAVNFASVFVAGLQQNRNSKIPFVIKRSMKRWNERFLPDGIFATNATHTETHEVIRNKQAKFANPSGHTLPSKKTSWSASTVTTGPGSGRKSFFYFTMPSSKDTKVCSGKRWDRINCFPRSFSNNKTFEKVQYFENFQTTAFINTTAESRGKNPPSRWKCWVAPSDSRACFRHVVCHLQFENNKEGKERTEIFQLSTENVRRNSRWNNNFVKYF